MKKIACVFAICIICIGMSATFIGCSTKPMKYEAYGLVHQANYIGYGSVTIGSDGNIVDVGLDEMCLPHYIKAKETVAESDVVAVESNRYFKTVKYNEVVMIFNKEFNTYLIGQVKMSDYFKDADNAEEYFKAAQQNKVLVMLNGEEQKDIMTNDLLLKSKNNYWSAETHGLGWKANRDATINYIKEHGFASAQFHQNDEGYWMDNGGMDTGATWTDLTTQNTNYYGYVELVKKAYDKRPA